MSVILQSITIAFVIRYVPGMIHEIQSSFTLSYLVTDTTNIYQVPGTRQEKTSTISTEASQANDSVPGAKAGIHKNENDKRDRIEYNARRAQRRKVYRNVLLD